MAQNHQELLDSLLEELSKLRYRDDTAQDALMKRAAMLLRRIVGADSPYLRDLRSIRFFPMYAPAPDEAQRDAWETAVGRVRNLVNTIKEELELFSTEHPEEVSTLTKRTGRQSTSIFVVHGHDEELKQSVARTLERLGLAPVILHEQPNQGRTVIEKFTDHSDVGFAVALLSADDIVNAPDSGEVRYRARQNVILELGFFLGSLGRERVAAIYKPHERFEMPSDYAGVLFIEYDGEGAWRYKLAKELKACGYTLNLDAIL